MACDLCGAKGTPLADLLDGYKTDDIKAVCPECERVLNKKLWKIRAVLDGSMQSLLKRWMGERRAAAFSIASRHTTGAPANCPACKVEKRNAGGPAAPEPNLCKLTECQDKPRCKPCLVMDASYGVKGPDA